MLGAIGVSTASAAITITLDGNVIATNPITAPNYFDVGNTQTGLDSTAIGGIGNTASGENSAVGGGINNEASGLNTIVAGGGGNTASGSGSTIAGGSLNTAIGSDSTIAGGEQNTANNSFSTVGGGFANTASGIDSTIAGGSVNTASGEKSSVPGGASNTAEGSTSFASGNQAKAYCNGCFSFADSNAFDFNVGTSGNPTVGANQFGVRATGGTTIVSAIDGFGAPSSGVVLLPGSNLWSSISDSRLKENISEYSVLDKLENYRAVEYDWNSNGRHDIGVLAQELESIFPEIVHNGSLEGNINGMMDEGVWSVEYGKLGALALQAIKEQQAQIKEQQAQIKEQQTQTERQEILIYSLMDIICADYPQREICNQE